MRKSEVSVVFPWWGTQMHRKSTWEGKRQNRKVSRHLRQWDLWAARLQAKCLKAEKEHAIVGHPAF